MSWKRSGRRRARWRTPSSTLTSAARSAATCCSPTRCARTPAPSWRWATSTACSTATWTRCNAPGWWSGARDSRWPPRRAMLTRQLILTHLEEAPDRRVTLKQLLRTLNVRGGERATLRRLLQDLVREGRLRERRHMFELQAGARAPEAPARGAAAARGQAPGARGAGEIEGRMALHRDGFGFVRPEPALASGEDVFIPPSSTGGAMPGDQVAVRLVRGERGGGRIQGQVLRVLRRAHATLVGTYHRDARGNYVTPLDERVKG